MVRLKTALENIGDVKIGGGATNNTEIESDGSLKFNGSATVFEDEYASYFFTESSAAAPDPVSFSGNNKAWTLDGGSLTEILNCFIELPHRYKEGSDIEVHLHYFVKSATSGNFKIFIDYAICPLQGAIIASQTVSAVITPDAVDYCNVKTIVVIPGTGRKISDVISFRLYRVATDAEDTFTADVFISSFGIHFELDTIGSRQRYVK